MPQLSVSGTAKVGGYASAPCLLALNNNGRFGSSGNGTGGIYIDANATVTTSCGVGVKGSNSSYQININAGRLNASSGYNYINLMSSNNTVGGNQAGNISPSPTQVSSIKNPHQAFDALIANAPSLALQNQINHNGGSNTYSPGYYKGINLSNSASVTLNPGVYYIGSDGINLSSDAVLIATNVTIINLSGAVTIKNNNGNGRITMSAPTSCDYQGMILMQPISNTNTVEFMHNPSTSTFDGNLYLPGAPIYIHPNNTSVNNPGFGAIVADTMWFGGGSAQYKFNAIKKTKYYSIEVKPIP